MGTDEISRNPPDAPMPVPAGPATVWARSRTVLRVLNVRLRFVIVLAVAFLVIGQWSALRNYWDWLTRSWQQRGQISEAVSPDTEYFCPMDPGVVSAWPSKCGI